MRRQNIMITCSATGLDIIDITASQTAGEMCPSFTMTVKPHLGTSQAIATHVAWTPPALVTFTIDGLSWECVPRDVPVRITPTEAVYNVSYVPALMNLLRRAKLKKPAAWVAAPEWEINVYLKDIDTDVYQVFTKTADVYISNGWTIKELFSSLGSLTGYQFIANLPDYHIAQKTILCDEQTVIVDFLASLLPSGFRFVWTMQRDGLTVALLSPPVAATGLTVPTTCFAIECQTPPVEAYDSVTITGAPYKLIHGLSLGGGDLKQGGSETALTPYMETIKGDSGEMDGQPTSTTRMRTIHPDPYHAPFAVPLEQESLLVKNTLSRHTVTTTAYENFDAMTYETPRVVKTTRTISGLATALQQSAVTDPGAVLLSNKLQVLTVAEYLNFEASKRPTIIVSALPRWVKSLEITTDRKTYIAPASASKTWPEGTEMTNAQTTECKGYLVNGRFFQRSASASSLVQEIAAMLQQTRTSAISMLAETSKTVTRTVRTLQLQGAGAYRFEETRQTLDAITGAMQTASVMLPVNADPPSSPTRWRTRPLTATFDREGAAKKLVFRAVGSIPTSNPRDFETWATRLFLDMTQPRKTYSFAVPSLMPVGALLGGAMVTGWTCSQKGHSFSATITVE